MKILNDLISEWFDNFTLAQSPRKLYEPIEYTLQSGGKRIRPTLLLASAMAFGCKPETVKNQCLGIEMFHNFTLLHDDVMDNSDLRRGRPTVHRRWGENTAILSGDTMLTLATQLIADTNDSHLRAVLDTFNRTAIEVYEGQQLDMDFEERDDVTVEEYIEMIRLKTSVLLAGALKIGAIIAEASSTDIDALYEYGINLGLGFQLRDDYLDTFGDPVVFGKHLGGDILNDKKTWLTINARKRDQSGIMHSAMDGRFDNQEKIEMVTGVYRQLGLDSEIENLIKFYSEQAIKSLDSIKMDSMIRQYFIDLAGRMVERVN